jgi:hypothetical protein
MQKDRLLIPVFFCIAYGVFLIRFRGSGSYVGHVLFLTCLLWLLYIHGFKAYLDQYTTLSEGPRDARDARDANTLAATSTGANTNTNPHTNTSKTLTTAVLSDMIASFHIETDNLSVYGEGMGWKKLRVVELPRYPQLVHMLEELYTFAIFDRYAFAHVAFLLERFLQVYAHMLIEMRQIDMNFTQLKDIRRELMNALYQMKIGTPSSLKTASPSVSRPHEIIEKHIEYIGNFTMYRLQLIATQQSHKKDGSVPPWASNEASIHWDRHYYVA